MKKAPPERGFLTALQHGLVSPLATLASEEVLNVDLPSAPTKSH